ncbi:hypothetical protein ES332_D10G279000v1 [Gossypium tomentosum]|uniref:Uncharacterized protein n=1 Tax=Gossypium tomentosum TaxID=34277 RepID=A0A5D2JBQ7_GOSTO|nr:hypothetical protein ES332_D10G279000v1 [Gossypium tomentosum]
MSIHIYLPFSVRLNGNIIFHPSPIPLPLPAIPPPIIRPFIFFSDLPTLPSPPLPPIPSSPSSPPSSPPSTLLLLCSLHQIGAVTFVAYEFTSDWLDSENKHKLEAIIIMRNRVAPIISLNASFQLALKRQLYFHQDLVYTYFSPVLFLK